MTGIRLWDRGGERRACAVDAYKFPASVRQRFAFEHERLSGDDIGRVEDATRQWFRLAARHPRAKLSMPSAVVDDLWHEMVLHTRDYAEFCDTALGRFLHHVPESAMSPGDAARNRAAGLQTTLLFAQQDEHCAPAVLPLLFRVDRDLAITGGARYLADCGGRGVCYDLPGAVCLQHVTGVKAARRAVNPHAGPIDPGTPTAGSGAACGGCGGG
jgi:hypothetical protein